MSYLDPKEQVLDLQLTPYGKFLLSIGKLKPVYYAFFDDDVIYDGSKANVDNETQSDIEPRIQENTPRFSAQGNTDSIETDFVFKKETFKNLEEQIAEDFVAAGIGSGFEFLEEEAFAFFQRTPAPANKKLQDQPIGKYKNSAGFAPAWNAAFFKAPLSSSSDHLTISGPKGEMDYNIPQLNVDVEYVVQRNSKAFNEKFVPEMLVEEYDPTQLGKMAKKLGLGDEVGLLQYSNGASIFVVKDYLVIRLEESHTNFEKENFEIEFFEVYDNPSGEEVLYKRKFYKDYTQFVEDSAEQFKAEVNSVEYDFNLLVDTEIDPEVICPLIVKDKTKQFYKKKMFDCENIVQEGPPDNIYLDVDDTEDICE